MSALSARINAELQKLSITRIIAAHRPDTLAAADRVLILHEGRLEAVKYQPVPLPAQPAQHASDPLAKS
jgi:ATP-binding cassette, subfamily B, bacterial CvaB/MchF/RaxB